MDLNLLRRAVELSLDNVTSNRGGPFGAVVVKKGKIIGEGTNRVLATNDPSAHAEVVAIRQACKLLNSFELRGCEIYSSCEPCPMCMGLIYWSRADKVYYANTAAEAARIGFDDAFIYGELALPPERRSIKMERVICPEAMEAFTAWEKKPDKTQY